MEIYNKIKIHITDNLKTGTTRYVLESNQNYYESTKAIVDLIDTLQKSVTHEEAIISYIKRNYGKYTPEEIIHIVKNNIDPLLFSSPVKRKTFIYQRELLSSSSVDKFSNKLSFLFRKNILYSVIVLVSVLDMFCLLLPGHLVQFNDVNIYIIMGVLVFTLFSTFIHELGHASACKYFGVKHGGIGFGLYLNFPLLYTDVTEAWKLKKGERCIVNIAGIYFQLFLLIILIVIYLFTNDGVTGYLILAMNLGFIMTLNPFFKFDGYWIVSDLLDIPNLRKHSKELLKYVFKLLPGKKKQKKPYILSINKGKRIGLLLYTVAVNLFMVFYFFYIIPGFIIGFVKTWPDIMQMFNLYSSKRQIPPLEILFPLGMQCLFALLVLYLLIRTICTLLLRKNSQKY